MFKSHIFTVILDCLLPLILIIHHSAEWFAQLYLRHELIIVWNSLYYNHKTICMYSKPFCSDLLLNLWGLSVWTDKVLRITEAREVKEIIIDPDVSSQRCCERLIWVTGPACSCSPVFTSRLRHRTSVQAAVSSRQLHSSIFNAERPVLLTAVSFVSEQMHSLSAQLMLSPIC